MARTPGKGYSVMQEGVCREVICFKGRVTERTRKWVFFSFKSVLVLFSSLFPIPRDELYIHTKY